VEGFLDELAARADEKGGPLAIKLPRAPGAREQRWAHLLGGPVDPSSFAAASDGEAIVPVSELAALKSRVATAEAELDRLRARVDRLYGELDISQ
jgi:uncharacterized protein YceH (UPF0502 family)